jgi:hypothetical protein
MVKTARPKPEMVRARFLYALFEASRVLTSKQVGEAVKSIAGWRRDAFEQALDELRKRVAEYERAERIGMFDGRVEPINNVPCPRCGVEVAITDVWREVVGPVINVVPPEVWAEDCPSV